MILTVQMLAEIPQLQILDKVVGMPVLVQQEVSENSGVNSLPKCNSADRHPDGPRHKDL